jgi:hypothetical protein
MYSLANFREHTSQSIVDKVLLVWSKESGYHFLAYDEWQVNKFKLRIVGVELC